MMAYNAKPNILINGIGVRMETPTWCDQVYSPSCLWLLGASSKDFRSVKHMDHSSDHRKGTETLHDGILLSPV